MPHTAPPAAAPSPRAPQPDPAADAWRDVWKPETHLLWARTIARDVRRAYRFQAGSQEELDLEQTAYLTVVKLVGRFKPEMVPAGGDPVGAFRGYGAIEVKNQCRREARRLRNGGTYRTRREIPGTALVAESLSFELPAGGTPVVPDLDPPEPEWSPYCTDPD